MEREKEKENKRGRKKEVSLAMIAANNDYAGFGPGIANLFRSMVGLPELSWTNQQPQQQGQQSQISNPYVPFNDQNGKQQSRLTDFIEQSKM